MIVCLNANCVIYLVEKNPIWGARIAARLATLRTAGDRFAVTDLARTECLAGSLHKGDAAVVADFQALFSDPDIQMLPLTSAYVNGRRSFERPPTSSSPSPTVRTSPPPSSTAAAFS